MYLYLLAATAILETSARKKRKATLTVVVVEAVVRCVVLDTLTLNLNLNLFLPSLSVETLSTVSKTPVKSNPVQTTREPGVELTTVAGVMLTFMIVAVLESLIVRENVKPPRNTPSVGVPVRKPASPTPLYPA